MQKSIESNSLLLYGCSVGASLIYPFPLPERKNVPPAFSDNLFILDTCWDTCCSECCIELATEALLPITMISIH